MKFERQVDDQPRKENVCNAEFEWDKKKQLYVGIHKR